MSLFPQGLLRGLEWCTPHSVAVCTGKSRPHVSSIPGSSMTSAVGLDGLGCAELRRSASNRPRSQSRGACQTGRVNRKRDSEQVLGVFDLEADASEAHRDGEPMTNCVPPCSSDTAGGSSPPPTRSLPQHPELRSPLGVQWSSTAPRGLAGEQTVNVI